MTNNFDYLTYGRFLYETYTSLTFHNIPADAHIPMSTPTVRGHAEACPSTTYAKFVYLNPIAVAARCRDFHSIRNSARVGRAPGALLCFGFSYSKFTHQLSRISKTSHTIWLKFGTQLRWNIVRTNPY